MGMHKVWHTKLRQDRTPPLSSRQGWVIQHGEQVTKQITKYQGEVLLSEALLDKIGRVTIGKCLLFCKDIIHKQIVFLKHDKIIL